MRKTKIICTLGPATTSYPAILALARAGMNVARLNFSHGDFSFFRKAIANIKKVRKKGYSIAILQDLQGPKIRVGNIPAAITVKKGDMLNIKESNPAKNEVSIDYRGLYKHVKPGHAILINDGMIQMKVVSVISKAKKIICRITAGGEIQKRKGVNLPGTKLPVPALTGSDKKNLVFGLKNGANIVALSFVRTPKDILQLVAKVKNLKNRPLVIAKIEKPEALKNIDAIIDACDGIMVARGDLAVEAGYRSVPYIQKKLITKANAKGKLAITATQMLESMINGPFPQRAEITDIYNSVLDGTDTVMLSGETSVGKYPAKTVKVMADILKRAETDKARTAAPPAIIKNSTETENVVSYAAAMPAIMMKNTVIAVNVREADDINYLSDYRPHAQIVALTENEFLADKLSIYNGVYPVLLKSPASITAEIKKRFKKCENIIVVDFHPKGKEAGIIRFYKV